MGDSDSCIMRVDIDQAVKRELKRKGGGSLPCVAPCFSVYALPAFTAAIIIFILIKFND